MACSLHDVLLIFAGLLALSYADEIAWGDVDADGTLTQRSLDVPVAMARGAENFFISNPMDSHDWTHTSVVRSSLKVQLNGASGKVAALEEQLRPIFAALPKDAEGRLANGTARYALHRLFAEKHGWSIKGLQPAGATWMATMSVTPDVKDVTKYMVPTYLQDLLLTQLGMTGFDLHALAVLAASMEHMIHSETVRYVYDVYMTLGMPIPGKRSEDEVNAIIDTFLMVYAFGVNLDASMLADVQRAQAHLEKSHSAWPQMQAFAKDVKQRSSRGKELDFDEIVQVCEKIGENYVQWQGKDCRRVKDELTAKPSHAAGRVQVAEFLPSHAAGRRSLFTESVEDLKKLGVLSATSETESQLIISNYVNSQSMCLSTASFYTACCVNECEGLLGRLEREVAGPAVAPAQLQRLVAALPGSGLAETMLQELPSLADQESGMVLLHSRAFSEWMHRAFPLECPAPQDHRVTNPKTADEWIGESGLQEVADLEEMMAEIAQVLAQYTTMGKKAGDEVFSPEPQPSDPSVDVFRVRRTITEESMPASQHSIIAIVFYFSAMISMMALAVGVVAQSLVTRNGKGKVTDLMDFEKSHFV